VSCPIYAFLGDDDATAIYENVAAWAEHTTSDFVIRALPGGHHYIDNLAELVGDIEQRMSQLCQRGWRNGPERRRNTLTMESNAV